MSEKFPSFVFTVIISECSVKLTNGKQIVISGEQYTTSISTISTTDNTLNARFLGGVSGQSKFVKNCSYNGESIIASGYVGGVSAYSTNTDKSIAIINGMLYSNTNRFPITGGIVGLNLGSVSNVVSVANKVTSINNNIYYDAYSGDVIGDSIDNATYDNVYSYSSMDVTAINTVNSSSVRTNIIGARRTLAQIKRASFLKQLFGPEYQSLAHLEEDPDAVWVIKNDEYPELYFTVLNDITVSDVEHGTISVDKTQAVDDEIITVTAVPDEGYKLNKIYVNGEEITGTTFTVAGDSDVYATFAEIPAEYRVSVAANANASAGLVNVDTVSLQSVSLFSDNQALTATDGEEIKVNTQAAADYTVDAIYVNGEELAGDSFIVTDDSVVTMDAVSISTDVKAATYEAKNIRANGATLSGNVDGDESSSKYIRYWRADTPNEIYTTEVETGSGEYSAEVTDLEPYVEYDYQMTEFGNVKSFTPEYVPIDDSGTEPVEPTEEPTKRDMCFEIQNQSKGKFSVSANVVNTTDEAQSGLVIYAAYDGNGKLVKVETETITDLAANGTFPVEFAIADGAEKYKILVWDSWKSMLPIAASVDIE